MSERWHKLLVGLEALLLAAPVTYLGGLLGVISFITLIFGRYELEPYEQAQTIVYLLPLLPLLAGWVLIVRFMVQGRAGLNAAGTYLWWVAGLGAAIILVAILTALCVDIKKLNVQPTLGLWTAKYFRELAFGLPTLVPLVHLLLLRQKHMPSSKSLNTDAPKDSALVS